MLPRDAFVDVQRMRRFFLDDKLVHADDDFFLGLDGALVLVGSFGDFLLRITALDGLDHAAHGVQLAEVVEGSLFHLQR